MNRNTERFTLINYGNIKPDMYEISNYGAIRNIINNKMLHPWKCKNGYQYATLMQTDNKPIAIGVHVLVAHHFIKKPNDLLKLNEPLVPNHKDFDRENNYYKNLEWTTYAMNNEWNMINNRIKVGEECPNAKVSNILVHKICELMEQGYLNKDIVRVLDLEKSTYTKSLLTRIRTGKQWKSISSQYNIKNKNTLRKNSDELVISICELLEKKYSAKQMRAILGIPNDKESKDKFKKLVWFIRKRKSYQDISKNYNW